MRYQSFFVWIIVILSNLICIGTVLARDTVPVVVMVSKQLSAPKPILKSHGSFLTITQNYAAHILSFKKNLTLHRPHSFDLTSLRKSVNTKLALLKKASQGRLTKNVSLGVDFERGKSYAQRNMINCKFNVSYHL